MSVGHTRARVKALGRRAVTWLTRPRTWSLWKSGRHFATYVLVVDAVAIVVAALTAAMVPITGQQVLIFGALVVVSTAHLELNRRAERLRELATEGAAFTNSTAIWTFAALVVLPPPLVVVLIAVIYAHLALRIRTRGALHAWVFNAANAVLASAAAGVVLVAADGPYPGWPAGLAGVAVVGAAAVIRWLVNSALLLAYMGAMPSVGWRRAWRNVFGTPSDDVREFASLSFGALVAMLVTVQVPALLLLIVPLLATHHGLQARQLEVTAQRDPDSGFLRPELWRQLAAKALERAERFDQPAGYLYIRLDKTDPGSEGQACGRTVRLVADTVRATIRDGDLVARLPGGPDFAVLVSDIPHESLTRLAHRIRLAVRDIDVAVGERRINGLTVSIGGACYPDPADSLDALMTCADNAVFMMRSYKHRAIDMVSIVAANTPPSTSAVAEAVAEA